MTIGERIKEARERSNITQSMLAKKMDVTPQNISQYERNLKNPKPKTIRKIAIALDVPMSYLMGVTNDPSDLSKTHWLELSDNIEYENCYKPKNSKEQEIIKKYRTLDEHGIDMVDTVLEKEYTRVIEHQEQGKDQSKKETPKVYRIPVAARGGGVSYVEQTQEEHDKAEKLIREKYPELLGKSNID